MRNRIESTKRLKLIGEVVLLFCMLTVIFIFRLFFLIFSSKDVVVVVVVVALFLKQKGIIRRSLTRCVITREVTFLSESTIILTWKLFIG